MTLNPKIIQMLDKYSINEPKRPPYFKRSKTPKEVIEKVEQLNEFYEKNYGKIFMVIED